MRNLHKDESGEYIFSIMSLKRDKLLSLVPLPFTLGVHSGATVLAAPVFGWKLHRTKEICDQGTILACTRLVLAGPQNCLC